MRLQLKIIELLTNKNEFTINQIAKKLNESYSFVNRTIKGMIKDNLISKEKIGHSIVCRLNMENDKAKALMILNEVNKKQEFLKKNRELKLITDEIKIKADSIAIFGSYAKNTQAKGSDIDLLILKKTRADITGFVRAIHAKYGKEISPIIITKEELKKNKPLLMEIIKYHIILSGFEDFINLQNET